MHEPGLGSRPRRFAETPQEITLTHSGLVGEPAHGDRLAHMLSGPLHYQLKPAAGPLADRRWNELLLSAVTMRCNDQPSRHAVGYCRTKVAAYEVKPGVDSGGAAGGGDDLTFVYVEDVGYELHPRKE